MREVKLRSYYSVLLKSWNKIFTTEIFTTGFFWKAKALVSLRKKDTVFSFSSNWFLIWVYPGWKGKRDSILCNVAYLWKKKAMTIRSEILIATEYGFYFVLVSRGANYRVINVQYVWNQTFIRFFAFFSNGFPQACCFGNWLKRFHNLLKSIIIFR